jgi:hypothetical protein
VTIDCSPKEPSLSGELGRLFDSLEDVDPPQIFELLNARPGSSRRPVHDGRPVDTGLLGVDRVNVWLLEVGPMVGCMASCCAS